MSHSTLASKTLPLTSVLVRICRECGVAVEHLRADQLIRDAREAWPGDESQRWNRWLREAGESVTLRARVAQLPLREALQLAQDGALLVGGYSVDHGVTIVVDSNRSSVTIAVGEIDERNRISRAELQQRLGDPADDEGRYTWLVVEHPELADIHDKSHTHEKPTRRLLRIVRPEWPDIWVILTFAFFVGVLSLATPIAVESLVNFVAFGSLVQPVLVLAAMLFGFLAFAAIITAMQTYVAEIIQQRLFARVAADLAYRLPRVDHSQLGHYYAPELVNRFFDVVTLQKFVALVLLDGVSIVLASLVGMAVLAFYHPWLLGFDILLLIAIVGGLLLLGRGGIPSGIDESTLKYRVGAWFEDLVRCAMGFKTDGGAAFAVDRANSLTSSYLTARKAHFRVLYRQLRYILCLQVVAGTVLLGGGGWLVIQNQLTLGQLVAAELIVSTILGSLAKLFKQLEGFYDVTAAVDKIGKLFDLPVERQDGMLSLPRGEGSQVEFTGAQVARAGPALKAGLTIQIDAGERVALLGPHGSGKTSLLATLYGARGLDGGHVLIEQTDPRDLRPDILRSHVALAGDVELFDGTITENIDLRRPGVSIADVRVALDQVGLLDEVLRLKDGMETRVSASGAPFSSSQTRLIMIARALAGRPRLLLVDSLLDALPDNDYETVLATLLDPTHTYTAVVATGRRVVADRFERWIDLGDKYATIHENTL